MPKISKIIKKQPKRASIPVDSNVSIGVERDGDVFRSYYKGSKVSEVSGTFIEWCFNVEDYNICFSREELEAMLGVG
jgi:hypothetical protein